MHFTTIKINIIKLLFAFLKLSGEVHSNPQVMIYKTLGKASHDNPGQITCVLFNYAHSRNINILFFI